MTPKQEKFAQCIADGMNQADAYRTAYDASKMKDTSIHVNASKLMADNTISDRVRELRAAVVECWLEHQAGKLNQSFLSKTALKATIRKSPRIQKSKGIEKTLRYAVLMKAGFKCQACGAKPLPDNSVSLHIDHILPKSMGGSDLEQNLQVLCADCNLSKSNCFAYDHSQEVDLWKS
jgi:hypothetical protein